MEAFLNEIARTLILEPVRPWLLLLLLLNAINTTTTANMMLGSFWEFIVLLPSFFRTKYSLNAISHDSAIGLVKKALERGVQVTEVSFITYFFHWLHAVTETLEFKFFNLLCLPLFLLLVVLSLSDRNILQMSSLVTNIVEFFLFCINL